MNAAVDLGYSCQAVVDAFAVVGITLVCPGPPIANFSAYPLSGGVPFTTHFTDLSQAASSWSWNFGDSGTSAEKNPTHTYTSIGTFTVTLTATNEFGSDSEVKTNYITVTIPMPPIADFVASATDINMNNSVTFTDLTLENPTSWSWTFEGGTPATSTAQNPVVTYPTVGTFDVTLVATNPQGSDTEIKVDYINVSEKSYCASQGNTYSMEWIAGVQVGSMNNTSGAAGYTDFTSITCDLISGDTVNVVLTPGFNGGPWTEYWTIWIDYNDDHDFDDAGESVFSGASTSVVSGSFTVASGIEKVTRMRVSMKYAAYPTPCETFTYGEVEDYTADVSGGGQPPVANFSASATTIIVGQSVTFTDLSTNGPTSWAWTFNGGTPSTSNLQNPTITYNTVGVYTVSLTATNAFGSDTETKANYITVNPPPAPVANFSGSPTTIDEGQSVSFTDLSTNNPTSWLWTFVGGTPSSSTVKNPTITYNIAGTYTVELTATNLGGSDTETKVNYITVNIPSIVYCTSQGNSQTRGWISRVRVANLDNSSAASKYTDFTSKTANLTRGVSASVILNTSYSGTVYRMYWRIWIDYNHDGDFIDTGEQVFSKNATNSVSGSFTTRTSALTGNTRMRVSMKYNGYPTSCQTFNYGEVEDYTANIQ